MVAFEQPSDALSAIAAFLPRALRAKWIGLGMLLLGLVGTAAMTLTTQRLYRSEAVIMYERGIASATNQVGTESDSPRQVGVRLQDMFASRQRLEQAIKDLKLYPRVVEQHGMVEASDEMRARIKVTLREGYTYRISYDADDRDRVQKALAYLVDSVVEAEAQHRKRESDEAKRFLDTERQHADEDIKAKEAELSAFLTSHPQLASEGTAAPGSIIRANDRDRTSSGSGEIASLEMQSAQLEEALANTGRPRDATGRPTRVLDPSLVAAQARAAADLHAAQRDLADKQARFTDDHPDVKTARWHVKDAEAAMKQADAALASAPASSVAQAADPDAGDGARAAALRRALAAVRGQIAAFRSKGTPRAEAPGGVQSNVAVDTEWTRLSRAVSEARERQQQLEARQFQATLVSTLVAANLAGGFVVTDPPFRPARPIAGGRFKVALMGGVGSLALALLAVFVAGSLDRRLYDARDVERVVRAEILVIPRLTGKSD